MRTIHIIRSQWSQPAHAAHLLDLLDDYARSPEGGGEPLAAHVRATLAQRLATRAGTHSLLAFVREADGSECAAGFANAFEGFSTFAAQPLLNIHDLAVRAEFRGLGIAARLLQELEAIAREIHACKLTLEVLEGNATAQRLYRRAGFAPYMLDEKMGLGQYWQKYLPT